jgi:hypothetical protein
LAQLAAQASAQVGSREGRQADGLDGLELDDEGGDGEDGGAGRVHQPILCDPRERR